MIHGSSVAPRSWAPIAGSVANYWQNPLRRASLPGHDERVPDGPRWPTRSKPQRAKDPAATELAARPGDCLILGRELAGSNELPANPSNAIPDGSVSLPRGTCARRPRGLFRANRAVRRCPRRAWPTSIASVFRGQRPSALASRLRAEQRLTTGSGFRGFSRLLHGLAWQRWERTHGVATRKRCACSCAAWLASKVRCRTNSQTNLRRLVGHPSDGP